MTGEARELFDKMNFVALGLPPTGTNTDAPIAYGRLEELSVPTLLMCGDLDLPAFRHEVVTSRLTYLVRRFTR